MGDRLGTAGVVGFFAELFLQGSFSTHPYGAVAVLPKVVSNRCRPRARSRNVPQHARWPRETPKKSPASRPSNGARHAGSSGRDHTQTTPLPLFCNARHLRRLTVTPNLPSPHVPPPVVRPLLAPPHPPSRPSEVGTGHAYHFAPLATLAATVLPTRPTTSTLTLTNPHPLPRSRDGHLTALPPLPFRPRGSPARPRLSATHRSATETPRADVATENFKLPRANATFTPTVGHRQTTLGWLPARAVPTRSRHGVCCSPRHRCRSPVPGQCSR